MTVSVKLRHQQALKDRNESLMNGHVSQWTGQQQTITPSVDSSRVELKRALDRLRSKNHQTERATCRAESRILAGNLGEVLSNSGGRFLRITRSSEIRLSSDGLPVGLSRLVELLTGLPAELDPDHVLFLDTETTGLAGGAGTYAFLVGVGGWKEKQFVVEQFFMRDYCEERAMLLALQERLAEAQLLVTFNGKSFDVPLLESRCILSRVRSAVAGLNHIDLLYPARRLWKLRLGTCTLENLEREILGETRSSDIPGHQIPKTYFHFTRSGATEDINRVFAHNGKDIESLARLAVRLGESLSAPAQRELHPEDLLSAGKYLFALGKREQGLACTQHALQAYLKPEVRQKAIWSLASALKTQRRHHEAANLWIEMLKNSPTVGEGTLRELAIYYEHRKQCFHKALELVDHVLPRLVHDSSRASWEKRRARLVTKIARQESRGTTANKPEEASLFGSGQPGVPGNLT